MDNINQDITAGLGKFRVAIGYQENLQDIDCLIEPRFFCRSCGEELNHEYDGNAIVIVKHVCKSV